MAETLGDRQGSLAAPLIFTIVVVFQYLSVWLQHLKKNWQKGLKSSTAIQLRVEIQQLLKEASTLSQPSTFAQAAKLRRLAAAKEKELANYQESHKKEIKVSSDLYLKALSISKVLTYLVLVCWFWRVPVATIEQQLVQPFGIKFLSPVYCLVLSCLVIFLLKSAISNDNPYYNHCICAQCLLTYY